MVPVPIRIAVVVIGFVIFFASWAIKNSVDASSMPESSAGHAALLRRDALTLSMRVVGAFVIAVGLLMWVAAHKGSFL